MQLLFLIQGIYFIITGLWPVFHIESFFKVTGPKQEIWLVKGFGILITSIGIPLIISSYLNDQSVSMKLLGVLTVIALAGVDIYYVSKKDIPPIYLLDAVIEIGFVIAWSIILLR